MSKIGPYQEQMLRQPNIVKKLEIYYDFKILYIYIFEIKEKG